MSTSAMGNFELKNFDSDGFAVLPYPPALRKAVERTMIQWECFCALPANTKKTLLYSNGGAGVGYEFKEGIGEKVDRKENFDVTIEGNSWLVANADNINIIAADFIQSAVSLVDLIKPVVLDFARQAEFFYDLDGFVEEVQESVPSFFVRFLHYFGDRQVGEEIAVAHPDQSGFTAHLRESAPGLQRFTYDTREWVDMPVSEGGTVIIPAMQLQLRSKGELKALGHRVIATPETAIGGRFSAVCFVQLKNTKKYNKEKFGRLQEMLPGFNYDMPLEKFEEMFK